MAPITWSLLLLLASLLVLMQVIMAACSFKFFAVAEEKVSISNNPHLTMGNVTVSSPTRMVKGMVKGFLH